MTNLVNRKVKKGLLMAIIALIVFIAAFPLIWMVLSSLKPYEESYSIPPTLLPKQPTFGNFIELFELTNFGVYLWNSTIISAVATFLSVFFSAMAGYALSRSETWFARLFGRLVLFTYIFPPILMLIPMYMLVIKVGLADNRFGLSLTYISFTLPFTMWLLKSYFDVIPRTYEEAALVEGATSFQIFRTIVLPLAWPGIIATSMFAFIEAWNEYLYATVFISTDSLKNLAAGVSSLLGQTAIYSWGMLMSAAVIIAIPALVVFPLLQRHLIAGFGDGGLKE